MELFIALLSRAVVPFTLLGYPGLVGHWHMGGYGCLFIQVYTLGRYFISVCNGASGDSQHLIILYIYNSP